MKVVISQPMYFPWPGLLEQLRLADVFIHLDDVALPLGRSFITRVQYRDPAGSRWLSVPVSRKGRSGQAIRAARTEEAQEWRQKHARTLSLAYGRAPHVAEMKAIVDEVLSRPTEMLAELNIASVEALGRFFGVGRTYLRSSNLSAGEGKTGRLLGLVKEVGGDTYITGHGAKAYLDFELFEREGVRVEFMDYRRIPYPQVHGGFDPHVTALDLVANCGAEGSSVLRSGTSDWRAFLETAISGASPWRGRMSKTKKRLDPIGEFRSEVRENIRRLGRSDTMRSLSLRFVQEAGRLRYSYNFSWMGRPIIQFPQDIVAMQEVIWKTRPDLIIETGVAHGGSLVYYSSLLELLGGDRLVVGVDIEIRRHNRAAIEGHPMAGRIRLIEGDSTSRKVLADVEKIARNRRSILVVLDSNHTHDHVLEELRLYSPLVTPGSYLVVFDTVIEDMPEDYFPDRPWKRGNSPKTAVREFLKKSRDFAIDRTIADKIGITVALDGYLRRRAGRRNGRS